MVDFFSKLDEDVDVEALADDFFDGYKFLQEDPDNPSPSRCFRSVFILQLLASTHLNAISGFVNITGWDTAALVNGKDQAGVIALAAAAVRSFFLVLVSRPLTDIVGAGGPVHQGRHDQCRASPRRHGRQPRR